MSVEDVQENLKVILEQVNAASRGKKVQLVAVSKTKSKELVQACYDVGHRHFGENYVQELEEKATALKDSCPDICWHYIGSIQSNKIGRLCSVPNLYCIETVENEKQALIIEKEMIKRDATVRVNTSGEEQKGGVEVASAVELASKIDALPHVLFSGFMTIGSVVSSQVCPNPDFDVLSRVRKGFAEAVGKEASSLELSMGMSDDFETAIEQGSTNVRVGSKIFGPRIYKK